ncbi:hypothetical protein FRX31_023734 [Thalictrum thalictroides]|uniref:Uncharacterized protein n=1 Tax=Thalictrum thalictroides TaxID=46969 RepID=A0A7J6VPK2_THATH|nr:hypothetical protein FRX31_023734 [Thalictrum thalictroides]
MIHNSSPPHVQPNLISVPINYACHTQSDTKSTNSAPFVQSSHTSSSFKNNPTHTTASIPDRKSHPPHITPPTDCFSNNSRSSPSPLSLNNTNNRSPPNTIHLTDKENTSLITTTTTNIPHDDQTKLVFTAQPLPKLSISLDNTNTIHKLTPPRQLIKSFRSSPKTKPSPATISSLHSKITINNPTSHYTTPSSTNISKEVISYFDSVHPSSLDKKRQRPNEELNLPQEELEEKRQKTGFTEADDENFGNTKIKNGDQHQVNFEGSSSNPSSATPHRMLNLIGNGELLMTKARSLR